MAAARAATRVAATVAAGTVRSTVGRSHGSRCLVIVVKLLT